MLALLAASPIALSAGPAPRHGVYDAATVESNGLSKGPGGFHVTAFNDLAHPDLGPTSHGGSADVGPKKPGARPAARSTEPIAQERRGAFDALCGDVNGCVVDSKTGAHVPQFSAIQSSHALVVESE